MKEESFHHGNLREEVLREAMQTLMTSGVEALSLRSIAQSLNVSSAAPYRHFKNKEALIAELVIAASNEETHKMELAYEEMAGSTESREQRLRNVCLAYLCFAEERPHVYRLLFMGNDVFSDSSGHSASELHGYRMFARVLIDLIPDNVPASRHEEIIISCWAIMHGFTTLRMNGLLGTSNYAKEQAINAVIALVKSPYNA